MKALRVGIVGCGNISGIYFQNLGRFKSTRVVACTDLDSARAEASANQYKGVKAMTLEELLDTVDLVVNLTTPHAHAEVAQRAVEAGKHVYNEKPLTIRRKEARKLLETAVANQVRIGCAPDTFLGAGLQTCREVIDSGAIGQPVACPAFMLWPGHESWHPDPAFYYQKGGGPMFDMGPYYLTALIHLMGSVNSVVGSARASFSTRTITSEPKAGQVIEVEVPTHVVSIMNFASGAVGEITTSFDVWHSKVPWITVYGSEGSLNVPDPNGFGGEVEVRGKEDKEWRKVPLTRPFAENSRGIGVLDMAHAIADAQPHRASGELAYHVLDIMHSIHDSSEKGRRIELSSQCPQPTPLGEDEFSGEIKE